jgi:phosphohistidine phosphatase
MHIYLIRHAHAVDFEDDPQRPLSRRGEEQVRLTAKFLRHSKIFEPGELWHSSLLRARQTAELLAHGIEAAAPCTLMPGLEPEDDPRGIARQITTQQRPLAIVGHEPHLSALATWLVAGRTSPSAFVMKKCTVLALDGIGTHWAVRWHITPDLLA